ncbi:NADPH-dependent 7-cyano-7-deazaguanine reductase QueF [Gammaproteobacteria bacterium 42_54_T18]|nr:NADPH-dependent 7-cyano-7-deazaguanine reductase QueF [Gammaproteobacteria bacterium 42_54_T18]
MKIEKATLGKPEDSPLGQVSDYPDKYDASLLYPIPRVQGREGVLVDATLPFDGVDIWNAYEVSWLNDKGKPIVAVSVLTVPALSPNIVESKSLKLYLGSLNQSVFASAEDVASTIQQDVSEIVGASILVSLTLIGSEKAFCAGRFLGAGAQGKEIELSSAICVDDEDITAVDYSINATLLGLDKRGGMVDECLSSHLLRSNCPVTGQPDWATIFIHYCGPKISRQSLLKYIISYRNHNDFHEQCVERVFLDIMKVCQPDKLSVYGRYTRRGGIDINPFRSNFEECGDNVKLMRQ